MPAKHSQKLKLLYLMRLFTEETDEDHPLTMEEIVGRLAAQGVEAERRSVYEDIRLLQDFGMDIIGEKRKRYIYYLANREFELAELKLLVDTVSSARFVTGRKSQQLIRKLSSLTSRHLAGQLRRQVYVSGRVKTFNESIYYNVDAVHRGINENRRISFKYYDYDLGKNQVLRRQGERYLVSPYLLSWDSENYYMVAFHSRYGRLAHFRVDKMTDVWVEAEKRHPLTEDLDPVAYCKSVFGMFTGEQIRVKVRFASELIGVVIDRFGKDVSVAAEARAGQGGKEAASSEADGGANGRESGADDGPKGQSKAGEADGACFTAYLNVAVSPVFFSWLLQFGPRAQIVEPVAVRERMIAYLRETASEYGV
ncbi:MAG: WYL domain-containing protein [Clostridiales bacterium]|nr:WYL domain-containing protein [Clostridiales bacterium]